METYFVILFDPPNVSHLSETFKRFSPGSLPMIRLWDMRFSQHVTKLAFQMLMCGAVKSVTARKKYFETLQLHSKACGSVLQRSPPVSREKI